jgi:transcriptional regulator with XRE-family HTH domain/transcription elongation GreA/GreB family factor
VTNEIKKEYRTIVRASLKGKCLHVEFADGSGGSIPLHRFVRGEQKSYAVLAVEAHPSHVTLVMKRERREVSWSTVRRAMDRQFEKQSADAEAEDRYVAGRRLVELRRKKGLTAREVAKVAGISPQSLSRIEKGRHGLVLSTLEAILRAIGSSMQEFVEETIKADNHRDQKAGAERAIKTGSEVTESGPSVLSPLFASNNPQIVNPSESEVEFEKLCLALLRRHWSRPGLERFAKKGEEQFGVDIFDSLGENPLYGAQCKLKELWKSLEPAEIREEVRKAETFPSRLDHYAILTTGKISGAAQLTIQAINQEHKAAGLFTVELFTREKISELIRQYPEIEGEFYGGLRSEQVATVYSKLDYIAKLTESVTTNSATTEIDALIDEARARITPRDAQIAILLLNRIQQTKGSQISDWHRFRILTNLGAASLMLGKGTEAARYFLGAKPLRPDDELAIANEVLAYHLLLQEDETRDRSAKAIERFPNSARLRSLWIQAAPREKSYGELLDATPGHLQKDAEVASALSRRAMANGLLDRAIEHAKDATTDKPKWSQAHLLLAQAYFGTIAMAVRRSAPLKAEDSDRNLANSLAAADEAIATAETEGDANTKAQALALKADIAIIQGRKEDAAHLARESFGADPTDLQGKLAMAQSSIGRGNLSEGIRILEEAYVQANYAPHISYMLGQALMARGADADVNRAISVFNSAKLENLDRELVDPIIVSATRAMIRIGRFADVASLVSRPEVASSRVMVATIKSFSALKQSDDVEAGQLLDEAISSRQSEDSRCATDFLARTLMEAGRLTDALPILQELFNAQTPNFDVGLLLNCAGRLRQDKVILDTCEALYERGVRNWEVVEFESRYLEEYDFRKAISRLREFIAANPTNCLAKVRLAIIGTRYGQDDLIQVSEDILPLPENLPMPYAVPVIHLLQWHGHGKLAVDYGYRLLRAHSSELEAHKAYLASLMPGVRPDEIPATMDMVEIGSAVQYSEGSDAPVGWFVIEDTENPIPEFEEIPAQSDIARELSGKKVGDSFLLAKSPIRDRVGKIVQILSKYTRRFQVVGDQMQLKFGTQSVIQSVRLPSPERLSPSDLQPMLDSVKAHSEAVSRLRELYRSTAVTLHLYGQQSGHTAFDGLIDLAFSEDEFIRCAPPQIEVFANALASLGSKSTVVVDLTALASLQLLGISRHVLTSTAFRFVMTPATFTEMQQLRAKMRFSTAHATMYFEKGQHYFAKTTEEESERQKVAFEEYAECVEKNVSVTPVPQLATLTGERRDLLEKILGRHGLESALLALSPGHVLWTDDLVAGEVAKSELGVERVWTQAVMEHLGNLGVIGRSLVGEVHAKLVGFNYQSTHFTGGVMVAALRASNGSVDAFPMRQMVRTFEDIPSGNRIIALRQLAEFIFGLTREPFLPETKCVATRALLDKFPNDPSTNAQLAAFRSQCARLMTLNPVAQADFAKCFNQWGIERLTQPLILKPSSS